MEKEKKELLEDDLLDSVTGGLNNFMDFIYKAPCPICNQIVEATTTGAYVEHLHACHGELSEPEVWEYASKMVSTAVPYRRGED